MHKITIAVSVAILFAMLYIVMNKKCNKCKSCTLNCNCGGK